MAKYVAETCTKHGWHYFIGFEPDKPEDISDLEKLLNPPQLVRSEKIGRNEPCPCGSGKKYNNAMEPKTNTELCATNILVTNAGSDSVNILKTALHSWNVRLSYAELYL